MSDPERMSAQERCRIMADSRCQHPDGPASKAVCDRCWAAEIEAAERAAEARGYERGLAEGRKGPSDYERDMMLFRDTCQHTPVPSGYGHLCSTCGLEL